MKISGHIYKNAFNVTTLSAIVLGAASNHHPPRKNSNRKRASSRKTHTRADQAVFENILHTFSANRPSQSESGQRAAAAISCGLEIRVLVAVGQRVRTRNSL
jgi:hypothetical protein